MWNYSWCCWCLFKNDDGRTTGTNRRFVANKAIFIMFLFRFILFLCENDKFRYHKRDLSIKLLWNLSLCHLALSGLDPAAPVYDMESGLNASCAKFVQVIHTSKYFGTQKRLGHSDFYANKGKSKQPGCLLDTCNHSRATELFYASCFREYVFMGTNCNGTNEQSRFGLYNDGKEGCFQFDTSGCFGYADTNYNFFTYI